MRPPRCSHPARADLCAIGAWLCLACWCLTWPAAARAQSDEPGLTVCHQGRVEMIIGNAEGAGCTGPAVARPRARPGRPATPLATSEVHRVPAAEQQRRDTDRIRILQAELADEQRRGSALAPGSADGLRHRENLVALQRELARAGVPPTP